MLEPLFGHPQELREFVENHLEAPFDGTPEGKKAATQAIFDTFPGLAKAAREGVAKKADRRATIKDERREPPRGRKRGGDTDDAYDGRAEAMEAMRKAGVRFDL